MSEIIQAQLRVSLVQVTREHFLCGKQIHFGSIFFLKKHDWQYYEGPYALAPHHVSDGDFQRWLQAGMVYCKAGMEDQESWGQWERPVL